MYSGLNVDMFIPRWPPATVYEMLNRCPFDEPTVAWLVRMGDDFGRAWDECENVNVLVVMAGILSRGSGDPVATRQFVVAMKRELEPDAPRLLAIMREDFDWHGAIARNGIGSRARPV